MNTDSGEMVPRDGETQGEIVLRGNAVMKGYYRNEAATAEALRDGWFFSGDAAVWHENGYIQIKDRLKDDFSIGHSSLEFEHEDRAHENADLYGHGKWEDKLKKVPVIGKLLSKGIDNLQGKVNTLIKTAQEEAGETREAMKIVARYMKGETVGKESNEFLKTQMKDLFKIGGAVAAAIGFPPAAVIGFVVAKLGLGKELFKLDDADKTTTRGKDERKSLAGKIKTFDGVKYVPYKDVLPFLKKGDVALGESLDEAEFRGKDVPLNKPKRGGSKAYYVYVRDPKTKKIKKVSFGSGGLRAKIKNKEARNAFAKRHNCKDKKDRTKAGYWSCNLPRYASALGLGANRNTFW